MIYGKAKRAITLIFLAALLNGCATVSMMTHDEQGNENKIWQEAPGQTPKAVVLLLHGLNLKPSRMDDWSSLLSAHGAHVVRFALYGHEGNAKKMRLVHENIWRKQFREAAHLALEKSRQLNVPFYFIGFSLGALVALEWLASNEEGQRFDKMVLIAPAISVPWYSRAAIKALSLFGRSLILPSRSPEHYRANRGTSLAAYFALFALKDSLLEKQYLNANVDTLVLIDPEDELVDSRGIRDVVKRFKLSSWQIEIIDNQFAFDNYRFRHLMVDKEAIGETMWSKLSELVLHHFKLG
jgi:pimeloyl-ACP methyl ester carboxylesterase